MQALSTQQKRLFWVFNSLFLTIVGLGIFMEFYWVLALPIVLLIVGVALFRLDWLMFFIVFCTPLSLNLEQLEFGLGVYLPTEPLMFGAMLVFFAKLLYDGKFNAKVLWHPITLVILLNLIWIVITVFPSKLPVVSLKFLVARMWFVVTGYFIATNLFKYKDYIVRYFWLYIIPFLGVVIYTLYNHAIRGFEEKPAHWVMQPFYKDHTSYGAILAMYIPFLCVYLRIPKIRITAKILTFFVLLIFTVGTIFSYTRAAWVSLLGALMVFGAIYFRIRLKYLIMAGIVALGIFFTFQNEIFMKLEKNRQDSSNDLSEHVESISNVASDASNLERINRWTCALNMFSERPVFGYGPGTYSFLYAPYQHSSRLTIISTNFGDGGNAHSEYFGPLAETGVLGLVTLLLIIVVIYYRGIPLYYALEDLTMKYMVLASILGLTTYLIHGVLNNFLDTDKASVPFWGMIAVITAADVYHRKAKSGKLDTE